MNAFQLLGIGFAAVFALLSVLAAARRRLGRLAGLAWGALWTLAAIAIARPQLTVVTAQMLGIQRGADLVFYLAILGMFVGFFLVYVRLRRLNEGLTTVVRQLALAEERPPDSAGDSDPAVGD